jgi:hypothetical protein
LIVDDWTLRAVHGYVAVVASYLHKTANESKVMQRLVGLIPSISHSADALAEEMIKNVFSAEGSGPMSPGADINPLKVSSIVCDNASVNTVAIEKINQYIASKYP